MGTFRVDNSAGTSHFNPDITSDRDTNDMTSDRDATFDISSESGSYDWTLDESEEEDPLLAMLRDMSHESIYHTINPEYDSQIFLRSMIEKYKTDNRKVTDLMESEFDPDKKNLYELADIKIQSARLLERIHQFFFVHDDYDAVPMFQAVERLENVCKLFLGYLSQLMLDSTVDYSDMADNAVYLPQSSFKNIMNQTFSAAGNLPDMTDDVSEPSNYTTTNRTFVAQDGLNRTFPVSPQILVQEPTLFLSADGSDLNIGASPTENRLMNTINVLNQTINRYLPVEPQMTFLKVPTNGRRRARSKSQSSAMPRLHTSRVKSWH